MHAVNLADRADTARSPRLALARADPHAVERCRDVAIAPAAGHAFHHSERLLGRATAVFAGLRLADAQLGVLTAPPVDRKDHLPRRLIDIGDDARYTDTAYYVTATADLLGMAADRAFAGGGVS